MSDNGPADAGNLGLNIRLVSGEAFEDQRELVRSTGASFDGESKSWFLSLNYAVANGGEGLNRLFRAASEFGTTVTVGVPHGAGHVTDP